MKFELDKKEFVEAVNISSRAVSGKQNMPILSGIYIKAEGNVIEMQSTDYELGFIIKIDGEIEEEGEVILSGKYLLEVARKLPGAKVKLEYNAEERIAHISSGGSNFRLLSMQGDFPKIDKVETDVTINIKDNDLAAMIKRTSFAASQDDVRPVFMGCFFDVTDDTLTMAATNTHRLAVNTMTINNTGNNMRAIIPARALNELLHTIKEDEPSDITINHSNNQIAFSQQNIYMVTRLIEGEYPDYRRVIPTEFEITALVNKNELISVIDRVSLISRYHEFHTINFQIGDNNIHISSKNAEVGKAEEDLAAKIEGNELSISFNVLYLTDVLKIMDGDTVKLNLKNELSPIKLTNPDNQSFTYVVTPVRNQDI